MTTLFSEKVEVSDGFVTVAHLYQGDYAPPHVFIGFFLHRPPETILNEIIVRKHKGWHFNQDVGVFTSHCSYICYQSPKCDLREEWEFAQELIKHPDRIKTREEFLAVLIDV